MPMMHGFGTIENKLTGRPTHYIQRFRSRLLHIAGSGAKAGEFGGQPVASSPLSDLGVDLQQIAVGVTKEQRPMSKGLVGRR
ncbi:hypothetical protein FHR88_004854 [Bradyrhizobium betae]|nr:hypothetical protein [Bradyrhizobium betae]